MTAEDLVLLAQPGEKTQLTLFEMRDACELGRTVNCAPQSRARLRPTRVASP